MTPRRIRSARFHAQVAALLLAIVAAAPIARAAGVPKPEPTAPLPGRAVAAPVGLPAYQEPAAYSVDMLIHSPKADMVMKRFIDGKQIRTEISGGGEEMVMIELGDEQGTNLMLMPKEKRAMKQSRAVMETAAPKKAKAIEAKSAATPAANLAIEDLGDDTLGGKAVKKLRMTLPEGSSLGWFDKATGAPVRMEGTVDGETTVVEWKNYKVAPQPAKLFEAPKDYELTDMDEMMKQMKGMGGMGGIGGMGGVGGMMGGMAQNMGQSMGQSMGSSLGASLGGPLGAMAGHYLGGKIGGMVGKKAVAAVTPGK
jgi:hypothetical protein